MLFGTATSQTETGAVVFLLNEGVPPNTTLPTQSGYTGYCCPVISIYRNRNPYQMKETRNRKKNGDRTQGELKHLFSSTVPNPV